MAVRTPAHFSVRWGSGSLLGQYPPFYWVTVTEAGNVAGIAELGVVFLLFRIGLGLSLTRLTAMRRFVLGMGGLQVLLTASLLAGLAATARARNPRSR